jgi:CheY-like chemotaxis protein
MKVLVVDDSRAIRSFVKELLGNAGFAVDLATDGCEALEKVAHGEPDVILLDVEMPGLSGLEVLEKLPSRQRLFSIILFTTRSGEKRVAEGLRLGADDYITKPFQEEELVARVSAAARATLAAGIAHQINNPLGFVTSNFNTLIKYAFTLQSFGVELQEAFRAVAGDSQAVTDKIDFISHDLAKLQTESREGLQRISLIVQSFMGLERGLAANRQSGEDLGRIIDGLYGEANRDLPSGVRLRYQGANGPMLSTAA